MYGTQFLSWQRNVTTSIKSQSPFEVFASKVTKAYHSRNHFGTLLIQLFQVMQQRGGFALDPPLLAEMNGLEGCWVLFPGRAGGEGHKRRLPSGKEERKKVLSSISTSFPRRWKSRPAQRITVAIQPFVSPFEVLPLPSLSITYPGTLLFNH